jgi:hypothetical protein
MKIYSNSELTDDIYHGEQYAEYLSGSELWAFLDKCPAEAKYGEPKKTDALAIGSMIHMAILEPELFAEKYARDFEPQEDCLTSDAAMKTWLKSHGITGYSSKKGFDLVEMVHMAEPSQKCLIDEKQKYQIEHKGKEFIKPDLYDQIKGMASTMARYPSYSQFIADSNREHSIIGHSEVFDCLVKTKPDIWRDGVICNYKTTTNASPEQIIRDAFKFGYFMKEVFTATIVEELTGEWPVIKILAQSKNKPYVVTGITLTDEQIEIGKAQLAEAVALWKACKKANAYIDYAQGQWLEIDTPQYMISQTMS